MQLVPEGPYLYRHPGLNDLVSLFTGEVKGSSALKELKFRKDVVLFYEYCAAPGLFTAESYRQWKTCDTTNSSVTGRCPYARGPRGSQGSEPNAKH